MTRSTEWLLASAVWLATGTALACPRGQQLDGYGRCVPTDRDGDGIRNDVDSCPTEAEDPNGFQDDDGCPDEALRLRGVAAREAADAAEAAAATRVVEACFDAADQRAASAHEGFTSLESAAQAQRACLARYPREPRAGRGRVALGALESEMAALAQRRAEAEIVRRHKLAADYRAKANVQYALGGSFAVIAGGALATAFVFQGVQPFGKGSIKNEIAAAISLGWAIGFGYETFMRFQQGFTHDKSAKQIQHLAATSDGWVLVF